MSGDTGVVASAKGDAFTELQEDYYQEYDFNGLAVLLARLSDLETVEGRSCRSEFLRGHILHRRSEWYDAHVSLQNAFKEFPDQLELCYEAALNGIDAGCYDDAGALLDHLSKHLHVFSDRHLRGIWRAAGVVGNIDLARAAFDLAEKKGSELAVPAVGKRIEEAVFAQSRKLAPIISIGENCTPWMLPNRWGLRPKGLVSTQLSMFNLGQSSCGGVAKILRSLGEGLTAPEYLGVNPNDGNAPFPDNGTYEYAFNHERGVHWTKDDFANLQARYKERIISFRKYLKGAKRVFFFYSDRDGDLNSVVEALYEINDDSDFRVVVVDLFDEDRANHLRHYDSVSYARLRFPTEDYIWWKPDHHDSEIGVYFERSIRDMLIEAARLD